jgi:glycosyltransferase involved in cell wall biosynthesis
MTLLTQQVTEHAGDDVWLELPAIDAIDPQVSIVIPALNEELTITDFVDWCHEGLRAAGVVGEIVIVDSSSDRTSELALEAGARVLHTPKRGLGRAYIDALPFVRAPWIVMGDADCTYDFRQLGPFVEAFRQGNEFVMGSRWKGTIEKGSMPVHHRYFGTPLTTWILNRLYAAKFSDIHCGMRGITKDALTRMGLQSQSWEYASEMVLKSVHMRLRTAEVPVTFLKDRDGRVSHHKREGWFSPFKAAWINLRAMFVHGVDFFTFCPGALMLYVGLLLTLPVSVGKIKLGPITLSLYWQLFGVTLSTLGLVCLGAAAVAKVLFDYTGAQRRRWLSILKYTRTAVISGILFVEGLICVLPLVRIYVRNDYSLPSTLVRESYLAVTGLFLIIASVIIFIFTLLVHAAALASRYAPMEEPT